jgi:hypothetical protein
MAGREEGYGAPVPEHLFVFIQMEFPWDLGPAAGRYLMRAERDAEPERVIVLGRLRAGRVQIGGAAARGPSLASRLASRRTRAATPEPAPVSTTRATVIDPVSVSAEHQARAWLEGLDREREVLGATAALNRVLYYHRIASADPYVREVTPARALLIRAGWGEGEQVAEGAWAHAHELPWSGGSSDGALSAGVPGRHRSAALRSQERLATLLGARGGALVCEELTLRARVDMDQDRVAHAAMSLELAMRTALAELRAENRQELAIRVAELEQLHAGVEAQAAGALDASQAAPAREDLEHALGRLEAALRARTASGLP